jgi:hypothetical protein
MEKHITDERTGLKYELIGDYPSHSFRNITPISLRISPVIVRLANLLYSIT